MSISLSVVVPVFNEGARLHANLERLHAYLESYAAPARDYELIVVDDASTDATPQILEQARPRMRSLTVLAHGINRGMSGAVQTGVAASKGAVVVVFDSDLTYEPAIIEELASAVERGADVAVASAYARGGKTVAVPRLRAILSTNANRFLSLAVRGRIATLTCMVRAYRGELVRRLYAREALEGTFGVLFAALKNGAAVAEIPAALDWSGQPADRSSRVKIPRLLRHSWDVLCAGFRMRPLLLLAIPGLIPGLLPAVVAGAFLARLSPQQIAICTGATLAVQYGSLALLSLQLCDYGFRRMSAPQRLRRTSCKPSTP